MLGHLSEAQRRALVIADNQLALNAGWDEELLRVELALLHKEDYDLNLLGFDDVELARLLAAQDAYPGLIDQDAVLEPPAILTMPDGSTVTIDGPGDYLGGLLGAAFVGENISPEQSAHLELIRQCTDSKEPGGGHLVDLIRCFLLGPGGRAHESELGQRR